jgi:hypothetical protein
MTEVSGKNIHEGIPVIVSEQRPESSGGPAGGTNPFTPQLGRARSNAAQGQGQGQGPGTRGP